jgi:predicted extracellular nuclease
VQDATGAGVVVFVKNSSYDVAIGDVFTLTGSVQEYYDLTEVVIDDVANISKTASGEATTPVVVNGMPTDWEPYEGQLITISDVEVTSAPNYGQVSTNYAGLFIDDLFTDFTATTGDTFSSVTGVLYYSYEEWKLEPRDASDLVR